MHEQFQHLFNDIAPALYRYFCGSFPSDLSDDLVQETLLRLFEKLNAGAYDPSRGSERMFAFGIAYYVRMEALRLGTRTPLESPLQDSPTSPETLYEQKQQIARLRAAIAQLTDIQQDVLLLSIDRNLQITEIAVILGLPIGTVKSHLHRAQTQLKKILLNPQEEYHERQSP